METLEDNLGADISCLLGVNAADIANDIAPIEFAQDWSWFEAPGDANIEAMRGAVIDNRAMMVVSVCGANIGQAQTLVAEDGVPFTGAYSGLPAPVLAGADFRFIHDRPENALQVVGADGEVVAISAGKAGPRHSPDDIESLDALLEWHDRIGVDTTFSDEGVLFRYRLHIVEQDGHELLVARGGLVPGIRWADVFQVMQSEVSPEFIPVETDDGVYLEYAALSLVFHGNTNTTLSMERSGLIVPERPQIRLASGTQFQTPTGGDTMTTEIEPDLSTAKAELEEFFAELEQRGVDRAAMLKACGATPCGPCSAKTDADTEELTELEKVTAERDALLAEKYAAIHVDTTPLNAAAVTFEHNGTTYTQSVTEHDGVLSAFNIQAARASESETTEI